MKNLIIRSITGIVFVAVIVAACIHIYGFLILFTLITGLVLWEFYGLTGLKGWRKAMGISGGMYLFTATFFYAGGYVPDYVYLPYLCFLLFFLISGLYLKKACPVNNWALELFAQFYCAGLFALLNFVAFNYSGTLPDYRPHYILLIFMYVWLNDTGAYLIGSTFGKHRLFPRISPLKSWEGFWGGWAVTVISSLFFARYCPAIFQEWYHWPALAVIVVVFGTWGDLVESLIKRTYGVKDSGTLLPGHGGILDRLDGVILASPAVYVYMECFIRN
ncbi:MAG: phosphatidate cytidylyltransferase [Tannerella sp.]|nr:phosphatidate cytidylyltransferase [Tannerella sp.]